MERLRTDFQSNAKHNAMLIRELLTIVERFNREGIPIIPFKDPLSACKVYGNVALRVFHDLDVFIHEGDVARATEILRTQGYTLIPRIDGIGEALEVAIAHDRLFAKDPASYSRVLADRAGPFDFANDRAGTLELHWDFSLGRQLSITRNNEQLWARARKDPVDGTQVCSFSPEDSLLVACIHGTIGHFWRFWKLIVDVAVLITADIALNWDQLMTIAREHAQFAVCWATIH
jgi:hypothetical protein